MTFSIAKSIFVLFECFDWDCTNASVSLSFCTHLEHPLSFCLNGSVSQWGHLLYYFSCCIFPWVSWCYSTFLIATSDKSEVPLSGWKWSTRVTKYAGWCVAADFCSVALRVLVEVLSVSDRSNHSSGYLSYSHNSTNTTATRLTFKYITINKSCTFIQVHKSKTIASLFGKSKTVPSDVANVAFSLIQLIIANLVTTELLSPVSQS